MENNITNIKDLPQVEEALPGNYLILEDQVGTRIIDFKNFIIGPANTSFYNAIVTNIKSVSTYALNLSAAIAKNNEQVIKSVDTRFVTLTSIWAATNPLWYFRTGNLSIDAGSRVSSSQWFTPVGNINENNISIRPVFFTDTPYQGMVYRLTSQLVVDNNNEKVYSYTLSMSVQNIATNRHLYEYLVMAPYFNV